jgi:hypothetical protein
VKERKVKKEVLAERNIEIREMMTMRRVVDHHQTIEIDPRIEIVLIRTVQVMVEAIGVIIGIKVEMIEAEVGIEIETIGIEMMETVVIEEEAGIETEAIEEEAGIEIEAIEEEVGIETGTIEVEVGIEGTVKVDLIEIRILDLDHTPGMGTNLEIPPVEIITIQDPVGTDTTLVIIRVGVIAKPEHASTANK